MSGMPDLGQWIILALVAASVLSALRLARQRRWLLALLQPLLGAGLLALLLWTPAEPARPIGLLTAGASSQQAASLMTEEPGREWLVLPGGPIPSGARPIADLAAALRLAPSDLHVVGDGLSSRQLAMLGALPLRFTAGEWDEPAIVAVRAPNGATPGQRWSVTGQLQAVATDHAVHLIDPAGRSIVEAQPDAGGRFSLSASTPLAGQHRYALELRQGDQVLQRLPLSVGIDAPLPHSALLLAATPSPELKFLRRWASDAGIALDARIGLSPGLAVRRGNDALSPEQLAEIDLLIVDERSWQQLGTRQEVVLDAVRSGLGLLLRVSALPAPATLESLNALGVSLRAEGEEPLAVALPDSLPRLAPGTSLHAWPLSPEPADAAMQPLGTAERGAWVALGKGRIGATWLIDTYQWAQQGQAVQHATHWSKQWQQLARPRDTVRPWRAAQTPLAGSRVVLCGGAGAPALIAPDGRRIETLRDPEAPGCVGFWPDQAGRWRLDERVTAPQSIDVFSREEWEAPLRAERRAATAARAARSPPAAPSATLEHVEIRGRGALFVLWLLLMTLAWWLERRVLIGRS